MTWVAAAYLTICAAAYFGNRSLRRHSCGWKADSPGADGADYSVPYSADETLDIGEATGTPASEEYQVPSKFTDDLKKVAIQLTDVPLGQQD